MNRNKFLEIVRNEATSSFLSLEIGALHKPHLIGNSVRYLDVFTTDQLRENYKHDPNVNIDDIVDVHYLGFDQIKDSSLDLVFSSHNVEHQPDLVRHFQTLERILNVNGQVFFVSLTKGIALITIKTSAALLMYWPLILKKGYGLHH